MYVHGILLWLTYSIPQFIDRGNIDGLALFRNLIGKVLTDNILLAVL